MNNINEHLRLGEKLRNKRNEHNLSQEDLAQKLHVTRQTISGWERGRSEPDIATLQAITKIYGLTIDEMLDNVHVEESCETLKKASLVFFIFGIALTGAIVWGTIVGGGGVLPLVMSIGYCVITNTLVWFSFSGAIKSGDVSMLAGYDSTQAYHLPTLRKLIDAQRFWLILSTTLTGIPFLLNMFSPIRIGFSFIVFICISHIICVVMGFRHINNRYSSTLYVNPEKAWVDKVSSMPLLLFLGSMFLTLFSTAIGVDFGNMENNSGPALLFVFLMILAFVVQLISFIFDMNKAKVYAEKREKYRLHKLPIAGYSFSVLLDGLLIIACFV